MQELPPGFRIVSPGQQRNADPVIAPPNPYEQRRDQRDERRLGIAEDDLRLRREAEAEKRAKRDKEKLLEQSAIENSISSIDRSISILRDIRRDAADNNGWGETGTSGNFMRSIPWVANAGKDLERKVESVKGLNAFAALTDLAEQGVKLTPISNAEIQLAASSVSNIDPTMTQAEFLAAVDRAIEFHSGARKKLTSRSGAKPKAAPKRNSADDDLIRKYLD